MRIISRTAVSRRVETIMGCKWSLTVFELIKSGISRPGQMVRSVQGLTTKVLNDCLRKNTEFGILHKTIYPESPPKVEYQFTDYGQKLAALLDQIIKLEDAQGPEGPPLG